MRSVKQRPGSVQDDLCVWGFPPSLGESPSVGDSLFQNLDFLPPSLQLQYNLLTQLRRSADRYSGEQHFAADSMQKHVSKVSAKFSKFESRMAARRRIIEGSLRLHTSLRQWKEQCEVVAGVLKQEGASESGSEGAESQEELVQQLRQIGDVVIEEASSLMELMITAMRRSEPPGGGGGGEEGGGTGGRVGVPDYSTGMSHIKRVMEEVENHRRRLGQLAEAKKVQGEQIKQIDSCEKDAKQVTTTHRCEIWAPL